MEIIGGMAGKGRVSLSTASFRVVSRLKRDGTIASELTSRSRFQRFLLGHKYLLPRSVVVMLLTLTNLKWRQLFTVACIFIGVVIIMTFFLSYAGRSHEENAKVAEHYLRYSRPLVFLPLVYLFYKYAAGYHAVEHMATAAYEKYGPSGIDKIAEQSRLHKRCVGRFIMPSIVVSIIFFLVQPWIGGGAAIVSFIAIETILWIDVVIGLENIKITARASELIQEYVSTKPPTEQEIRVGREALKQLLLAHKEI